MRTLRRRFLCGVMISIFVGRASCVLAETPPLQQHLDFTGTSIYNGVRGDRQKFQEDHWIKEGYVGGMDKLTYSVKDKNGITADVEGKFLVDNGDYEANVKLEKKNAAYALFHYRQFRKYYDGSGLFSPLTNGNPFNPSQSLGLDRDLALNIGDLGVEVGTTFTNLPKLRFKYDREFKKGNKSLLAYDSTTNFQGTLARKTTPSLLDMDETLDTFRIEAEHTIKKVDLSVKQMLQRERLETNFFSNFSEINGDNHDIGHVTQTKNWDANTVSTVALAQSHITEKWYVAGSYAYIHNDLEARDRIRIANNAGQPFNFSEDTKNRADSPADVDVENHVWSTATSYQLNPDLFASSAAWVETRHKDAGARWLSLNPGARGNDDGTIDRISLAGTTDVEYLHGESIQIQYKGIPKTSVYSSLDFQNGNIHFKETQLDGRGPVIIEADETFRRDIHQSTDKNAFSLGFQNYVSSWLSISSEVKRTNRFNEFDEALDAQKGPDAFREYAIRTNEFVTRTTLRPIKRLVGIFKYQFLNSDFNMKRYPQEFTKANYDSHVYTATASYALNGSSIVGAMYQHVFSLGETSARLNPTTTVPPFWGNYSTLAFNGGTQVHPKVRVDAQYSITSAGNYDNYDTITQPLVVTFATQNLETGITLDATENMKLAIRYAYSQYDEDNNRGLNNYHRHGVMTSLRFFF